MVVAPAGVTVATAARVACASVSGAVSVSRGACRAAVPTAAIVSVSWVAPVSIATVWPAAKFATLATWIVVTPLAAGRQASCCPRPPG